MFLDGIAAYKFLIEGNFWHFIAVFRAHMSFYRQFFRFYQKRKHLMSIMKDQNMAGYYNRSVVWAYFVQNKREFPMLEKTFFKEGSL